MYRLRLKVVVKVRNQKFTCIPATGDTTVSIEASVRSSVNSLLPFFFLIAVFAVSVP